MPPVPQPAQQFRSVCPFKATTLATAGFPSVRVPVLSMAMAFSRAGLGQSAFTNPLRAAAARPATMPDRRRDHQRAGAADDQQN